MRAFRAWFAKELREQRTTVLLALVAVALGTAVPFVAFPDTTAPRDLHPFPGYALALVGLVLASGLFARDLGAAHALVLRTPGAHRVALPAKLLVLCIACALAVGVEEAVRHGLSSVTGVPHPYAGLSTAERFVVGLWPAETRVARLTAPIEVYGVPMPIASVLAACVVTTWAALGSVLSSRRTGALVGGLLLAVAAAPFLVMHGLEPRWFAFPASTSGPVSAGVALFACLLASVGWWWGRATLSATRRTALRVAAVGGPVLVAASLATASAVETWRTPDPSWPDLQVLNATLGSGGTRLYLTVSRGMSDPYGDFEEFGTDRVLAEQAWIVGVADGALRDARVGAFARVPGTSGAWHAPTPWAVRSPSGWTRAVPADGQIQWIRAGDDDATFAAGHHIRSAATVAAAREVARTFAPIRLPDGRRVYGLFGGVEREGDETTTPVPSAPPVSGSAHVLADGAFRVFREGRRYEVLRVEVDAKGVTEAPALSEPDAEGGSETIWLSANELLWRSWPAGADLAALPPWERVKLRTASSGAGAVEQRVPQPDLVDVEVAKPGTLLLHRRSADGRRTLRLWDLAADTERAVDAEASLLDGFVEVQAHGRASEDGAVLEFRPCALGIECASSLALLTISTGRVERVTPPGRYWPVALESAGTFLVIEDGRRIVRFAGGGTRREVVFPRR